MNLLKKCFYGIQQTVRNGTFVDISGKIVNWAGYYYLFFAAHNDSLYCGYTGERNKGEGQLLSTYDGIAWNTLKTANQIGVELPFTSRYYSASIDGRLYISTYRASITGQGNGPEIWATSSWENISLVKKFEKVNTSGMGATPAICKAFNKLCLFMYSSSMYEYSGKLLFLDNSGNFSPCSELPVFSDVSAPLEFLNHIFLIKDSEIWISK